MKYEQRPYLEDAKQDLHSLQALFKERFGYEVLSTYALENPNTETLNLDRLNEFLLSQLSKLSETAKDGHGYDGLIFVWCGYGGTGDTLITSDNHVKALKDIQEEIVRKSYHFVQKPKIFIDIVWDGNDSIQKDIYGNMDNDTFVIVANIVSKSVSDKSVGAPKKRGSHFVEALCQSIQTNGNSNLNAAIQQSMRIAQCQEQQREICEIVSMIHCDVILIPNAHCGSIETLNLKKHWNRNWRQANAVAATMVEQMMNKREQGVIVVTNNMSERRNKSDDASSFLTFVNDNKAEKKIFGVYCTYVIKKKCVVLDVDVDGNVYAVDCEIQCKGQTNISSQLFVTSGALVDAHLQQCVAPIQWNTKIHHDIPVQLQELEYKEEECSDKQLFDDALVHLQKHLQLCIDGFGLDHLFIAVSYNLIALAYDNKGCYDEAVEAFEKALKIVSNAPEINYDFIAQLHHNLAITYDNKHQSDKSIECYETSLQIRLNIFGSCHVDVAYSYYNMALVYSNKGQYDKSIEFCERSLKIRLDIFGTHHDDVANSYHVLGNGHFMKAQYDKAVEYYGMALKIKTNMSETTDAAIGDLNWNLGLAFEEKAEKEIARKYYEEAWKAYSMLLGEWHEKTLRAKESVSE
ncbi:hypothetical protein RFI_17580 [Reticulomyxa filosa]|uniref:Peptidase C14 caspase domain-containing protein n=1 Tax=Reticulomyxa filosa TaxID=46433 RepID=X6N040_RETFI|nr:hypothetical protein RFI_17580 [Reticulomyxa filosa]|eukprot:ETO19650.1 hypothetical protein RFI_17580 [Reticulomyxa filosa]